ncbi:hypothetical protein ACFX13_002138 [Malus domestica]
MDGDYEGNHLALLLLSDRRWIYSWVPSADVPDRIQFLSWSQKISRLPSTQSSTCLTCAVGVDWMINWRFENPTHPHLLHMVRSKHPAQVSLHHHPGTPPRSAFLTV